MLEGIADLRSGASRACHKGLLPGKLFYGRPLQKFTKNRPRRPRSGLWDVFWIHLSLKVGLRRVMRGFRKDLGWILEGILDDFEQLLRKRRFYKNIRFPLGKTTIFKVSSF